MSVRVFQYAKCSTCRKALKWLDAHGVDYEAIPIVDRPPSKAELKRMWRASGLPLRKLFNTSGQSYRLGGFKERLPKMSEDECLAALAADGKLCKRPLLEDEDGALVGFSEPAYAEHFA